MTQHYMGVLRKYAVFEGRASRSEYWYFTLMNVIIGFVLGLIGSILTLEEVTGALSVIYMLAVIIPSLAVSIRRLHDTDRSGWWLLIGLIPLIGPIVLLVFFVLDSTPGDNRFGQNPKGVPAAAPQPTNTFTPPQA